MAESLSYSYGSNTMFVHFYLVDELSDRYCITSQSSYTEFRLKRNDQVRIATKLLKTNKSKPKCCQETCTSLGVKYGY